MEPPTVYLFICPEVANAAFGSGLMIRTEALSGQASHDWRQEGFKVWV
ncbi:MAG: hypothetical protein ABI353_18465 [Isosphaeraceae bacterium]